MANLINSVIAIINGQQYQLELNTDGKYAATLTAPADSSFNLDGGYFPVEVTATYTTGTSTTVNDKTDGDIGMNCRLVVRERIKPTIDITYPTAGAYITSGLNKVEFIVLDNQTQTSGYSGIDLNSVTVTISGSSMEDTLVITGQDEFEITEVNGGYSFVLNASGTFADGEYTVSIDASDNDGNAADTAIVTAVIDVTPPELSITSPAEGFNTSNSVITVAGSTSDSVSKPISISVNINGEDRGTVPISEDGSFSQDFELRTDGEQVIIITAVDAAGMTTSVTRNIYFSTSIPVITNVTLTPNEVDGGKTFVITVEVI